jgi:uncharacterized protein (DUF58 family)
MRRFLLIVILAYLLILVGMATFNRSVLALSLPLIVFLGASLFFAPSMPNLQVQRMVSPERASSKTPISVELNITNQGDHIEELLLEDVLPNNLELLDGETSVFTELPPNGVVRLAYTVRGGRGIYAFSDVRATAYERLGLIRRQRVFQAPGKVFVVPETPRLKRVAIRPRQTRVYSGSIPARQGGHGIDFFGVRSYQAGDSLRHINWRVSARHTESLFSNEYEQERVADVWLLLDARQRSDVHISKGSLFEYTVTAAAGLAQALLNEGNRVGLLVYGGFLDYTYPGYGKVQREHIWRALARARPGDSLVFDQLENLPMRVFPLHSQLLLISPLHSEDLSILVYLRSRGYSVLVISPDPVAFEAEDLGVDREGRLGLRLARAERSLLISQLRQAGVHIFNWNVSVSFDRAMHRSLTRFLPWFQFVGVRR